MKRFLILFTSVVMISLGLYANTKANTENTPTLTLNEVSQIGLNEVKIGVPSKIKVIYAEEFSVLVRGNENIKNLVKYTFNDSVLDIKKIYDVENDLFDENKLEIRIFTPNDVKITPSRDFEITNETCSRK